MNPVEVAKKYLGMKENPGNKFDDSTILGQALHKAGQKDGEAWCAYFCEAVFCEAYPDRNTELRQLFSASAVQTFKNFKEASHLINELPMSGNLVVWQKYKEGKETWQGHIAIIDSVNNDGSFYTIEGNTNSEGSREGDSVQRKLRKMIKTDNGLNIIGFIQV